MAALGAELTLVPSEGGLTTRKLILDMIEAARELSREPGTYWTDQLNNRDSDRRLPPAGPRRSSSRRTAASTPSCSRSAPRPRCAAWRPCCARTSRPCRSSPSSRPSRRCCRAARRGRTRSRGSASAACRRCGSRRSSTRSSPSRRPTPRQMARRLAREEALFAGTSSGANVVAAIRVGERLGPLARIVTLLVDSGLKYLRTELFRRRAEA